MFGTNDPFDNHFNSIMNNFMMDPFAPPQQQQQQRQRGSQQHQNRSSQNQLAHPFNPFGNMMMSSPFNQQQQMGNHFSLMNQMMGNMNSMFRNFDQMSAGGMANNGAPGQVFSSSSVMTYTNSDGKPKVYQQSSQVQQGPGGVRETRHMVRDSEKGLEKVSLGHHIGDRAHIVERQKMNGGEMEEIVNLENLDDEEVQEFDKEFETRIKSHMRPFNGGHHGGHHRSHHHLGYNQQPFAIESGHGSSKRSKDKERKSKSKSKH